MKQLTAILLSTVLTLPLAACGDTDPVTTTAPAPTEAAESTLKPSADKLPPFDQSPTIEETVLVDENNVRITATGLSYTNYAAELNLTIENNSTEDLNFTSGTLGYSCNSVNGMMVEDGYLNCDVTAGKKAVDTISLNYPGLQLYGIQSIADLEIGICASNEDYQYTYFTPRQITTSAYADHDYSKSPYQETITGAAAQNTLEYETLFFASDRLYEQDGAAILSQTLIRNVDGAVVLLLEAENQSEDTRLLSVSDISINGLLVEDGTWTSVTAAPGKWCILPIDLSGVMDERYWDVFGIEHIGSIGVSLRQTDMEGNELGQQENILISCGEVSPIDVNGEELYSENDITLVAKAVLAPQDEYDSYFRLLLLAESTSGEELELEIPYHALSINGFMLDYMGSSWTLQAGQSTLMELKFYEKDLEEIGVTDTAQIEDVEFPLEIKQGSQTVAEPTIILNPVEE